MKRVKNKITKTTPLQKLALELSNSERLRYYIDIDYDYHYECQNGSDCCDNDYCRCGVIENITINSINTWQIADAISKHYHNKLFTYCVDRIFSSSKAIDPGNWEAYAVRGYYGEEMGGVRLNNAIQNDILEKISAIETLADIDKIKFILKNEYGYVLPRIEKMKNVEIVSINVQHIELPNENYTEKIKCDDNFDYTNYDLPAAICVKRGEYYSVIDGYHRVLYALKNNKKKISIIFLS